MNKYFWYGFGALVLSGTALAADVDKEFSKVDINKDGYISLDEAKREDPLLARNFSKFDTRQVGQLDQADFAAYEEMDKDDLEPFILRHEWYGDYGTPGMDDNN